MGISVYYSTVWAMGTFAGWAVTGSALSAWIAMW